jgi:CBS domain-containing protein
MVYFDDEPLPQKVQKLSGQNIMDIATSKVVCVRSDQSVGRVARILAKKQFKKMPVVNGDGALVGVIRRKSIIKFAFLNIFHNGSDAPRSDR